MEQCRAMRGDQETALELMGTLFHGKESLLHPSHSWAQKSGMRMGGELCMGWQKSSDPKMILPAIVRDVRWGGAEDDVEVSSLSV